MNAAAIPICFVCLILVLVWMTVEGKTHWLPKVGIAVLGVLLGAQLWCSIDSYRGFDRPATEGEVAGHRALYFWSRTDEPTNSDDGDSVLWMRLEEEIVPYHWVFFAAAQNAPQVYRFPYDRDMQALLQDFNQKVVANGGEPIEVVFNVQQKNVKVQGTGGGGDPRSGRGKWVAYDLPPAKIPSKVTQP